MRRGCFVVVSWRIRWYRRIDGLGPSTINTESGDGVPETWSVGDVLHDSRTGFRRW